jgi:hypothetical protein
MHNTARLAWLGQMDLQVGNDTRLSNRRQQRSPVNTEEPVLILRLGSKRHALHWDWEDPYFQAKPAGVT